MHNNPTSYTDPSGHFIPLVLWGAAALYKAYNVYDTVDTSVDNFNTVTDPNASTGEKALALVDSVSALAGVPKFVRKATGKLGSTFKSKNNKSTGNNASTAGKSEQPKASGSDKNTDKKAESEEGASSDKNDAALDANALIRGVEKGDADLIDGALNGRNAVVSRQGVKEFLNGAKSGKGGNKEQLRQFLKERGGRVGKSGTEAEVKALQAQAETLGRKLKTKDARVAASAAKEKIPVITNDKSFRNFLNEAGIGGESF